MANSTVLSGNLTRDPEIRYLRDGTACTTLSVAVDHRWQDRESGAWAEATSFFDVVAWRAMAEHIALSITKGDRVVVSGRLEQRSWAGEDGRIRTRIELVAEEVAVSLRFGALSVPSRQPDAAPRESTQSASAGAGSKSIDSELTQ